MHVAIVLVELGTVGFGGESGESFLENIHSQRLIRGDNHVDSQVELVPVDKQRVRNVARDNRHLVNVQLVQVFNDVNASTTGRVSRLHNPDVALRLCLLQLLVVRVEVVEFVWQNVSVWNEVELASTESLLHLDVVEAETILAGYLVALWEMVDALELVETLVEVALAGA